MALDGSQESPRLGNAPPGAGGARNAGPSHPTPGVVVRARGSIWQIVSTMRGRDCVALHVRAVGHELDTVTRTFLEPFERCVVLDAPTGRPRPVSRRAWIAALRREVASIAEIEVPTGLEHADIDLLPYQLEPAIALRRGEASRVLVADEVGLGKTIQAGIVIADLLARSPAARVLVVTPAGLREQWADELRRRFRVPGIVCGAAWLASEISRWPPGVNPWSPPAVRIVSIDFLKRPETLHALHGLTWDLLVVDEAHAASRGSDRGTAVAAVARRSRCVVCTTATPHNGAQAGFDALCALGRHNGDRLAVFRRAREVLRPGAGRRSAVLHVALSAAERRMHDRLAAYVRAATAAGPADAGAQLAMSVLVKRALSSARALELTATRRRALIAASSPPQQAALPFPPPPPDLDDGDVADEVLARPAFDNVAHERAWLGAVIEAARHAARRESKLAVVARLVRRAREPHLVFTEYRDTLHVIARALRAERVEVLHGAQSAEERRRALSAFAGGHARILLATDTASEGLNLHARCRSVVLFDLPWTPTRAEQRIGRVDRIGQRRRVHALSLVAAGTADERLVERNTARGAVIRDALGGADDNDKTWPRLAAAASHAADVVSLVRAMAQARRARDELDSSRRALAFQRVPTTEGEHRAERRRRCRATLVTALELRQPLAGRSSGLLVMARVDIGPAVGPPVERHLVPMVCDVATRSLGLNRPPARLSGRPLRDAVARLLTQHEQQIKDAAEAAVATRLAAVVAMARRHHDVRARRDEALAREREQALARALVQPGLFDLVSGRVSPSGQREQVPLEQPVAAAEATVETLSLHTRVTLAALFHVRPSTRGRSA